MEYSKELTLDELLASRKAFFQRMLDLIGAPPHEVDILFRQDAFYCRPEIEKAIINLDLGTLMLDVKPIIKGMETSFTYSIFHYGETLKIGVMLPDQRLEAAPQTDSLQEWGRLWGQEPVDVIWRGDTIIYEWTFDLRGKNFHRNLEAQERFTVGLRHVHLRLMRMFHETIEMHMKMQSSVA